MLTGLIGMYQHSGPRLGASEPLDLSKDNPFRFVWLLSSRERGVMTKHLSISLVLSYTSFFPPPSTACFVPPFRDTGQQTTIVPYPIPSEYIPINHASSVPVTH